MKTYPSIVLLLALGVQAGSCTPSVDPDLLPTGTINFPATAVPNVLEVYKLLVHKKFITDSRVNKIPTPITLKNERPLSQEEAALLIEQALLEQAAIVITPL